MVCHNCAWTGELQCDDDAIERLEIEGDRQRATIEAGARKLEIELESERIDTFASALQRGLILPEDF